MAHTIEYVSLTELAKHVHPENPKDHAIPDLIASFERFGFASPILMCDRTGFIAAGHGRLEALESMKANLEAPPSGVTEVKGEWLAPSVRGWASEDDDELLAYVIADNRQNELGGWKDNLTDVLKRLKESAGLIGTGYTHDDLRSLLAGIKSESDTPASNGSLLALADVTVGEPTHKCHLGDVYRINDRHTVVVADVMTGWTTWARFLVDDALFVPYPGPYAALSQRADLAPMVLVQPDPFLAGHLLDKFATSIDPELIVKVPGRAKAKV